jgi:hypothetical protein
MFASASLQRIALCALSAVAISMAPLSQAQAHTNASSEVSALSLLPVAISVAAPVALVAGGVSLTVVAVEASATGTALVVERASDGMRETLHFSGQVLGGISQGVGTAILCTAVSTGYVLSAAGQAIAFVPNEIGAALLYNERLGR